MRSEAELIVHHSVVELHQWIEEIFTGRTDRPSALENLMSSFSREFRMVTTAGQHVGLCDIETLFRTLAGARPTLRIAIDECETLLSSDDSVVCRYKETHHREGDSSSRRSLAVIDIIDGQPVWRFLQETAIAAD